MPLLRRRPLNSPTGAAKPVLMGTPQQRSPSGHVNLQDLLGLNREQGEQMGSALVNPVAEQAQSAKSALGSAQGAFGAQKQAGTVTYKPGMYQDQAKEAAQGYYSGPTSLEQTTPGLSGQVQKAADNVQRVGSQNGRMTLLQQQHKQGDYGTGARAFDSYLAGKGAEPQLQELQQDYGGLEQMLGLSEAQASAEAGSAKDASARAAAMYAADAEREDVYEPLTHANARSAGDDRDVTDRENAARRGAYGDSQTSPGDRLQGVSDLDWYLRSGKITSAQYDQALTDPTLFKQLKTKFG